MEMWKNICEVNKQKKLRFFEAKKKKKTLNKIQTTTTRDQKKEKENIQL